MSKSHKKGVAEMNKKIINHEAYGNSACNWSPRDFKLDEAMCRGQYGQVHMAREKNTSLIVGIKTLLKSQIQRSNCERQVLREIEIQSHLKDYNWSPRDFELGEAMGRGKFGQVHMAKEKKTGLIVAIKTLFKSKIQRIKCEKQVLREIEIQSHLKHPNILRLLTWFQDERRIYLVIEFAANGELYKHLTNSLNGCFPEAEAAKYIYQVADAVEYCHQHHVIHRDIKPENILVDYHGNLKLANFGWSVHAPSDRRSTMCGTTDFVPPEMIKGKRYDASVDLWSIGVLLYEFLVGKPPFKSDDVNQTYQKILAVDMTYPDHVPEGAKDLISKLLQTTSKERLSPDGVKKHYWVQQFNSGSQ